MENLAAIAEILTLRRGETIFSEGQPGRGLFAVAEGRVKIFKSAPNGKEHILHIFGPGEAFAEVTLFAGRNYPASAQALDDCSLLFFPRESVLTMFTNNPEMSLGMLAVLSHRLKFFVHKIEELSLKEVPARLATHLLLLSNPQHEDVALDLPKGQLANYLGTIPETLSRIMKKMAEAGYYTMNGSRLSILDRPGLERLAAGLDRLD